MQCDFSYSRYHPNIVDETKLSCSKAIYAAFECSRQNFMWQKVLSRARLKDWAALKDLAIDRGIFLTTTGDCLSLHNLPQRHPQGQAVSLELLTRRFPSHRKLHRIWALCRSLYRERRAQGCHRYCRFHIAVICSTWVAFSYFKASIVYFLKLLVEPELRYRYSTRVAEWEVDDDGVGVVDFLNQMTVLNMMMVLV